MRDGDEVEQETLHFEVATGALTPLRSKEYAHDYRYFPEPDLVPMAPTEQMIVRAREGLPELPAARAGRFEGLGLPADDARLLAFRAELGDYFEAALAADGEVEPRVLASWVRNELAARLGDVEDPAESRVQPAALAGLDQVHPRGDRVGDLHVGRGCRAGVAHRDLVRNGHADGAAGRARHRHLQLRGHDLRDHRLLVLQALVGDLHIVGQAEGGQLRQPGQFL